MENPPLEVCITVHENRAYIPVTSKFGHLSVSSEPVFIADLSVESLLSVIKKVASLGNPPIRLPEAPKELRKWIESRANQAPEARAAGTRTWKEFARNAHPYYISWLADKIVLAIPGPPTKSGAFEWQRFKEFAPDTPLHVIVEALLDEIQHSLNG